jgi:hypothetical protein
MGITEKELLAIIFGISKTREFIYGKHFFIVTDHTALKHILGLKDPHGRLARWSIYLSQFNFTVIYRNGRKHTNCDVLSRNPLQDQIPETQDTDLEGFLSVMDEMSEETPIEIRQEQLKDKFCQEIERLMKTEDKRARKYSLDRNGLLHRIVVTPYEKRTLLVLPKVLLKTAIMKSHDPPNSGHQGFSRTAARIMEKYYSPKLLKEVRKFVTTCSICQMRKSSTQKKHSESGKIPTTEMPFEIISTDLMGPLNCTSNGNKYVMVVVDLATRFIEVGALPTPSTELTIKMLKNQVIFRYGIPKILITDRGTNFTSRTFKDFTREVGIKHQLRTAYNPRANSVTERMNKTLGTTLAMYCHSFPTDWDELLQQKVFAINTSESETMKKSPFELTFARTPILPFDRLIGRPTLETDLINKDDIKRIRQMVKGKIEMAQEKNKRIHEERFKIPQFKVGDKVSLYKPTPQVGMPKKFQIAYKGPYTIVEQLKGQPSTFKIQKAKNGKMDMANGRNLRHYLERQDSGDELKTGRPPEQVTDDFNEEIESSWKITLPMRDVASGGRGFTPTNNEDQVLETPNEVSRNQERPRRHIRQPQRYQATFAATMRQQQQQ